MTFWHNECYILLMIFTYNTDLIVVQRERLLYHFRVDLCPMLTVLLLYFLFSFRQLNLFFLVLKAHFVQKCELQADALILGNWHDFVFWTHALGFLLSNAIHWTLYMVDRAIPEDPQPISHFWTLKEISFSRINWKFDSIMVQEHWGIYRSLQGFKLKNMLNITLIRFKGLILQVDKTHWNHTLLLYILKPMVSSLF